MRRLLAGLVLVGLVLAGAVVGVGAVRWLLPAALTRQVPDPAGWLGVPGSVTTTTVSDGGGWGA